MSQYTPEPWNGNTHQRIAANGKVLSKTDYYRATVCVNACAGIEDPAAYIADLKTENEILQKAFDGIANEFIGQKGFEKLSNYIGQVMKLKGATR